MDADYAEKLKRKTDLICTLIFCESVPVSTIAGERQLVRQWCLKFLPEKMELYDLVYESRFDRLLAQFRS